MMNYEPVPARSHRLLSISALAIVAVVLRTLAPEPAAGSPMPIEARIEASVASFPTNAPEPPPAPAADAIATELPATF